MKEKLRRIKPEDLPEGVIAILGEDYRERCHLFEHNIFGPIGRMIIMDRGRKRVLLKL